jgi:hypothetical protein
MFSRLFACFALVTGLAAIGAPASASEIETLSCQITASIELATPATEAALPSDFNADFRPAPATYRAERPVIWIAGPLHPTVFYGIDRAYE